MIRRSCARCAGRRKCAMSCIASAVSRWIASGDTWRKVRLCPSTTASNVDTPSVVTSRYGVSSGPIGSRSE